MGSHYWQCSGHLIDGQTHPKLDIKQSSVASRGFCGSGILILVGCVACLHSIQDQDRRLRGWGGIVLRLAHLLVPGLSHLGSSDASFSLCDLSMWILQHGGIRGPRLVTWPPRGSQGAWLKRGGARGKCVTFYNQSSKSHRITCTWSQACPDSRGGFTVIMLDGGMSTPHCKQPCRVEGMCQCGHVWKIKSHGQCYCSDC